LVFATTQHNKHYQLNLSINPVNHLTNFWIIIFWSSSWLIISHNKHKIALTSISQLKNKILLCSLIILISC